VTNEYERSLFWPDTHIPYSDSGATQTVLAFTKFFKPHVIFILGDFLDFYSLSKFDKDPNRLNDLQDNLDEANQILARIRSAAPKARIVFIYGNHEKRLKKYLWRTAKELSGLRSLELDKLLDFEKLKIEPIQSGITDFHGFVIKHGNIVRAKSGHTANAELEKSWKNGLSGHTHRLGQIYRRNAGGMFVWTECGCLCDLNPEYAEGQIVDWSSGLAYGYYEKDGNRLEIHVLPIIKRRIVFNGHDITG
jgi:predicted phosphodiesterase